ncbi:MAG: hypothetical protein H6510_05665 [Acidobacteria bacterium]|nr:hypothetical protein [Acidobacteriota bacterium]MCB9397280.1 hypothetical protein [Acidobacteriota bacterium]
MRIQESQVQLASQYQRTTTTEHRESLEISFNPAAPSTQRARAGSPIASKPTVEKDKDPEEKLSEDSKILIVKRLLESLLGKEFKWADPEDFQNEAPSAGQATTPSPDRSNAGDAFYLRYEKVDRYEDHEQSAFQAQGTLTTEDGRQLAFNFSMTMERHVVQESSILITAGKKPVDPLALNLDGGPAALQNETFEFDLNLDGQNEQFRLLEPGSYYLVLDKNADGKVNDGGELFGPASGNGFADLARYDEDGNQWIDEGDRVFHQLTLWMGRNEGNDQLLGLKQAGVGALYLGSVQTPFHLTDSQGSELGQIQQSGVFLHEDGRVGSLQQIDVAV